MEIKDKCMVNWYLGTMGFSYKDWVGPFYPADIGARDFLKYYGETFNSVEIDSTFYGTPPVGNVNRWIAVTPEGFKICCKMPKQITHDMELSGARHLLAEFVKVMRLLGDRLGVILIQFPPSFSFEKFPLLKAFLPELPADMRFAVEVRHLSWHAPSQVGQTEDLLREHRVSWAATEYEQLPKRIYRTTDFLYIRFIGKHLQFIRHDSEQSDVTPQLRWWWENIQPHVEHISDLYGYFNNDYAGFAAGTCNRFKSMFGFEVKPLIYPKQERLF